MTWLIFAVCALAVVEGLGYVTWRALCLEKSEREARAQSAFGEVVRLALWRMESEITPIMAKEAARPYFQYRSFYPAERAYTRMWQQVEPGEVLVPSPLLEASGAYIRLHYQVEPDGTVTSPQAPTGNMRDLAEAQYVPSEFIILAEHTLADLSAMVRPVVMAQQGQEAPPEGAPAPPSEAALGAGVPVTSAAPSQGYFGDRDEFEARRQAAQIANTAPMQTRAKGVPVAVSPVPVTAGPEAGREQILTMESAPRAAQEEATNLPRIRRFQSAGSAAEPEVETGALEALWRTHPRTGTPELLVQRTVRIGGGSVIQGFWLDWPALRTRLLEATADLVPGADLAPLTGPNLASAPSALRLASIPVLLAPGAPPAMASAWATPISTALVVTWLAVLAAIVAIAVVLRASMELSDRRGRFVSAVTHELRTPLTTFCLYTEMLADGMVGDEARRREYLGTLKGESRRLAGIVENVLDYARLGGITRANGHARASAGALIEQVLPALQRRAESAGMTLEADLSGLEGLTVTADPRTVERILLNLVDNACKYAAASEDRRVHVSARRAGRGGGVEITVRDHGPGVPRQEQRRIFQPFHRARRDADGPQSGLGLGLALARGLARSLGGDLRLVRECAGGAEFVLTLPAAARQGV